MTIEAVVFDLDGVVRHWDPAVTERIERDHGLATGAILDTAFDAELGPAAVTGALSYDEWTARIAERIGSAAVQAWSEHRGTVDPEAVALIGDVRASGRTVGVLSNATTRLEEDLAVLGLDQCFDRVFNTARLGVCKPDPEVYRRVLGLLDLPGEAVVFTDDLPDWAAAATAVGMHGIAFVGVKKLREQLRELDIVI